MNKGVFFKLTNEDLFIVVMSSAKQIKGRNMFKHLYKYKLVSGVTSTKGARGIMIPGYNKGRCGM